jgi:hypothetical protein
MVASFIPDCPDQLVLAAHAAGLRSADWVAAYLSEFGTPGHPPSLPKTLLLDLGGALWLRSWEDHFPHLQTGLPSARQCIVDALHHATGIEVGPQAIPAGQLIGRVLDMFAQRFAWAGMSELGADLLLDELSDGAALDAVAEFLWRSRHNSLTNNDTKAGIDNEQKT